MSCDKDCSVCRGRNFNVEGFKVAEDEVIPFFKRDLLQLKYVNHPFPLRYDGLLASCLAYSQALAYNRAHGCAAVFYTDNKWMLKFSRELGEKFQMHTASKDQMPESYNEVCEYNVDD